MLCGHVAWAALTVGLRRCSLTRGHVRAPGPANSFLKPPPYLLCPFVAKPNRRSTNQLKPEATDVTCWSLPEPPRALLWAALCFRAAAESPCPADSAAPQSGQAAPAHGPGQCGWRDAVLIPGTAEPSRNRWAPWPLLSVTGTFAPKSRKSGAVQRTVATSSWLPQALPVVALRPRSVRDCGSKTAVSATLSQLTDTQVT